MIVTAFGLICRRDYCATRRIRSSGKPIKPIDFTQTGQGFKAGVYGVYSETPATRNPSARSTYPRTRRILSPRKSKIAANGAST